ncbi:MAG TPA: S-adenosylmethionine:tRNA ribosyltransferase-isomerase, partial [Flavitalea sp.]|nr:S-adenosylmethionine:tRNA ribosyltransferase-isomerase [Flavitalea sp.]
MNTLNALLRRRAASVASGWLFFGLDPVLDSNTKEQPPHAFGISPPSQEGSFLYFRAMKELAIEDYTYDLPDEKIAHYPLAERDLSKLLIYKNGAIQEDVYRNISGYL